MQKSQTNIFSFENRPNIVYVSAEDKNHNIPCANSCATFATYPKNEYGVTIIPNDAPCPHCNMSQDSGRPNKCCGRFLVNNGTITLCKLHLQHWMLPTKKR